ncbi:pentatricopeptide repeat-containing protein At2g35030, mitochondrial-like [Selaginella moellendorffii]|uniref:pentatricopeptide repeat-containing protein At2g35030, mitochondrial-like n=1 Tax=Selaginella moellendorffii TaxID=88036 RepID=UPI000D1CCA0F|nr:pentatricopeptide repeat-containing protein At2g35030, mitochondrial-like [Selaginella moellendorffii]|eukprot:XP_024522964.1 pentatricopeptide repeat-containing protein At2g35030, mitochondrial-like [Selaginella moellendorffii]
MMGTYAQRIHCALGSSSMECNIVSSNGLIAALAIADLELMDQAFDRMPHTDSISWNTVMTAHPQSGDLERAKAAFDRSPRRDLVSWNGMIAAYAQHSQMDRARVVFEMMGDRNTTSWNTMAEGYCRSGCVPRARSSTAAHSAISPLLDRDDGGVRGEWDRRRRQEPLRPDPAQGRGVLHGDAGRAGGAGARDRGGGGFCLDAREGWSGLERDDPGQCRQRAPGSSQGADRSLECTRICTIGCPSTGSHRRRSICPRRSQLREAKALFDVMPKWNLVAWNVMLCLYAQNGAFGGCKEPL